MSEKEKFIHSWRDKYGSEMDKAKMILADKSVSGVLISNLSGVSRQGISNYRTGRTDIDQANWTVINGLARAYETNWIQADLDDDFLEFRDGLKETLTKLSDSLVERPAMAGVIGQLKDMTISDIMQLIELNKTYVGDNDGK